MSPDARTFLCAAIGAARLTLSFVQSRSFADYQTDAMLRSAVERQLFIVGEALGWSSCATSWRMRIPSWMTRWAAVVSIAGKIGATPQTLLNWVLQHGRDSGQREGVSCAGPTRS